jgi:tRNA A37 threonylcarbamoyladenosine dehydratase
MSQQLISHSADLRRLRDDGYEIAVIGGRLVITHVPYVNASRTVKYGTLISDLTLSGDVTTIPGSHVAYFAGDYPHDWQGAPMTQLVNGSTEVVVNRNLVARYLLSSKPPPPARYADYYEKMTTYISIISAQAQTIDASVTARTYLPVEEEDASSVFRYLDTASSRAGISSLAGKLAIPDLAIVGLGGTGSYILDLVAKTPVQYIHLFDGDRYLQHNAFRAPGAPTLEELRERPMKVDYLAGKYAAMHQNIVPHAYQLEDSNVTELDMMDFVFLAIDEGTAKKVIVERLETCGIPFIDVGMGIYEVDGRLAGLIRTTVSTPPQSVRQAARSRISFHAAQAGDMYSRNIQIADLNALNAALAVIAWKKQMGFYNDFEHAHFTAYAIDTNTLINEDHA